MRNKKKCERQEIKLFIPKKKIWTILFFIYIVGYFIGLITIGTLYLSEIYIPKQLLFQYTMIPVYSTGIPLSYLGVYGYKKHKSTKEK
ncbi:hypothetical protein [Mycoplasma todarodis]|uniref:Uncharacterized protein n=1 Tax=Mycoplasma todarodis TaxID=1937191 RepID=A0A4R0XJF2_9MOLU|nr:hypothetical protein [Mycoplasma todarodis]TCG10554.1 hypothetical protein C4B25_03735 [Mycoplasma todarodis]